MEHEFSNKIGNNARKKRKKNPGNRGYNALQARFSAGKRV
jgi:hypothetical protein